MLQNAYLLAKIGADTAENEQHFAEMLPTDALGREEAATRIGQQLVHVEREDLKSGCRRCEPLAEGEGEKR